MKDSLFWARYGDVEPQFPHKLIQVPFAHGVYFMRETGKDKNTPEGWSRHQTSFNEEASFFLDPTYSSNYTRDLICFYLFFVFVVVVALRLMR